MPLEEEELLLRQMPHSTEAEQAVLGSILRDFNCIPEVVAQLRPSDFYIRQNREISSAIYTMFNLSSKIDMVTILEQLKQDGVYVVLCVTADNTAAKSAVRSLLHP